MPVEIRELHITAVVNDNAPATETGAKPAAPVPNTDAIIAACVEQVLQILNEKTER